MPADVGSENMKPARPGGAVGAIVVATVIWGGTFVVIRDSLHHVRPVSLVFARFLAATALFALVLLARRRVPDREAVRGGALSGLLAAAGFVFQAYGLQRTSAGTSAFLTSTGSLLAGFFAWPILGQRPGALLAAALGLAAFGSALLAGPQPLHLGPGEAWTLLGAVAWALQIVAIARFAPRADPLAMTAVQAATIAVVLSPLAMREPLAEAVRDPALFPRLAYLIVGGSTIAPLLQVMAQRTLSAGRTGLLLGLEPVFALLFALTVGEERFAPRWWLGAALILVAVWVVEWHAARGRPSRPL